MPRRRILTARTAEVALEAAGRCRSACVQVVTEAPISGPAYQPAQQVLTAVDGLAEALVGDPRHFHPKPHGAAFRGSRG